MSNTLLSVGLDIIVICFLSATIFFVLRLYKSLNEFKVQRKQFDSVIRNLLSAINQAERSIQTLKDVSTTEAAALEKLIEQSKALSEELSIINGTGESIANRIEQLAEKNRKIVNADARPTPRQQTAPEKMEPPKPSGARRQVARKKTKEEAYAETLKKVRSNPRKTNKARVDQDLPSFMIQDHHDEGDEENNAGENLKSQAEKELYEALRSNKRAKGKGAS